MDYHNIQDVVFSDLEVLRLHDHATEVCEVVARAKKEAKIEDALASLEVTWSEMHFVSLLCETGDDEMATPQDGCIDQLEQDQLFLFQCVTWG